MHGAMRGTVPVTSVRNYTNDLALASRASAVSPQIYGLQHDLKLNFNVMEFVNLGSELTAVLRKA